MINPEKLLTDIIEKAQKMYISNRELGNMLFAITESEVYEIPVIKQAIPQIFELSKKYDILALAMSGIMIIQEPIDEVGTLEREGRKVIGVNYRTKNGEAKFWWTVIRDETKKENVIYSPIRKIDSNSGNKLQDEFFSKIFPIMH
jgi:hypothetical protein